MAEKRVSVRLGIVGGQEVEATFENLGAKGASGLKKLGDAAERSGAQINRSTGAMRAQFQNVGYQVQDFAVQVAGGTSATRRCPPGLAVLARGIWGTRCAADGPAATVRGSACASSLCRSPCCTMARRHGGVPQRGYPCRSGRSDGPVPLHPA